MQNRLVQEVKLKRMRMHLRRIFNYAARRLVDKADSLLEKHADKIDKLTIQDIIRIEQYFGVSHQAAVYQLNHCGHGRYINKNELDAILNTGVRRKAEEMGFYSALYRPYQRKNSIIRMVIILIRQSSY